MNLSWKGQSSIVGRVRVALWATGLLLFAMSGCKSGGSGRQGQSTLLEGGDRLAVVATVGMIADMARNIGGDCVNVTALMGPGVDPHVYRASASDVDTLRNAQVILYGGLLLEGRMADVLERLGERIPTLAVLESLEESRLLTTPAFAGHFDPHVWMDVGLWAQAVPAVEALLSEQRPDCEESMRANADAYRAQLAALDSWVTETMATIPAAQRVLVTAHDAFSYFGRAYRVEVVGIQGVSTEAEASVTAIRQIVALVTERRVPAIFVESSVNPRNIEAVRASARDRGWEVEIGGRLFSDAMGEDGTWQGCYIGMIRSNALAIAGALGGEPARWPDELRGWAEHWGLS